MQDRESLSGGNPGEPKARTPAEERGIAGATGAGQPPDDNEESTRDSADRRSPAGHTTPPAPDESNRHLIARLRERVAELEQWQRDMVEKAADKSLAGYRELAAQTAWALNERDAARAKLDRLEKHTWTLAIELDAAQDERDAAREQLIAKEAAAQSALEDAWSERDAARAEVERLMCHVRGSPALSTQYVRLAEGKIESLRAEVERLRTELADSTRSIGEYDDEVVLLQRSADEWQADALREAQNVAYWRAEVEALRKDAERLDFVECHLCRAGNVMGDRGRVLGIMKAWQIVTQLDEPLRLTIDRLKAAIDAEADAAREAT